MSNALDIAAERYAKGEISKDEFEDIRTALTSSATSTAAKSSRSEAVQPSDTSEQNELKEQNWNAHDQGRPSAPAPLQEDKKAGTSFAGIAWKGLQFLGGAVVVLFLIGYFTAPSSKGLTVGGIEAGYSSVRLNIVNNSETVGDVLMWVEQNDVRKCEHVFSMKANWKITNLSLPCQTSEGKFTVNYIWASSHKGRASVAKRLNF